MTSRGSLAPERCDFAHSERSISSLGAGRKRPRHQHQHRRRRLARVQTRHELLAAGNRVKVCTLTRISRSARVGMNNAWVMVLSSRARADDDRSDRGSGGAWDNASCGGLARDTRARTADGRALMQAKEARGKQQRQ